MWIYYHSLVLIVFSYRTDKIIFPISSTFIQLIFLQHEYRRALTSRKYILLLFLLCCLKPIFKRLIKIFNKLFWINWSCIPCFNHFCIILESLEKTCTLFRVHRLREAWLKPITFRTLTKITKLSQISVIFFKRLFAKNVPCLWLDLFHKIWVFLALVPFNKRLWSFLDIFKNFLILIFQIDSFQEKFTSFLLIFFEPKTSMCRSKFLHFFCGPFLFMLIFKSYLQKSRYLMQKLIFLLLLFGI